MTLTIRINLDNADYHHDNGDLDYMSIAKTIHDVSNRIEEGSDSGTIRDTNGNKVGQYSVIYTNHANGGAS